MSLSDHNETLFDQEEEITSRSPPPAPPNSPQQVLDSTTNGTVVPLTIAPLAMITSTSLQPAFTRIGPSRLSPFFLTPRSLIRHPPPLITEPVTQRRRVHDDLATLQYMVNAMVRERVEMIEEFNNLHARQVTIEDNVGTLRLELEASVRREEALHEELELVKSRAEACMRRELELRDRLENSENNARELEGVVLTLQGRMEKFEMMFEVISRAASITTPSSSH